MRLKEDDCSKPSQNKTDQIQRPLGLRVWLEFFWPSCLSLRYGTMPVPLQKLCGKESPKDSK